MKRRAKAREDKARRKMNWPYPTVGVPVGDKRAGKVKNVNGLLGKGGGGIEDVGPMPAWLRKSRQVKKK